MVCHLKHESEGRLRVRVYIETVLDFREFNTFTNIYSMYSMLFVICVSCDSLMPMWVMPSMFVFEHKCRSITITICTDNKTEKYLNIFFSLVRRDICSVIYLHGRKTCYIRA